MFGGLLDILILIGLLVIGFLIILFIGKVIWFFIPAGIIALVVFFLTGNLTWTGITFLVIAALSLLKKVF